MATEVKLPRLGQGMESGTIVKWLKGEGEPVKKREPLYELDTDKVTQEVEAEAESAGLRTRRTGTSVSILDVDGFRGFDGVRRAANLEDVFVALTGEEVA